MVGVELGDGAHRRLELHQLVGRYVQQRRLGAHPGGARGGVYREDALTGVEEVGGIAGDLERGERAGFGVLRDGGQKIGGFVAKQQYVAVDGGIACALLAQHLDHHVVGGLIDEGDEHLLAVDEVIAIGVLL